MKKFLILLSLVLITSITLNIYLLWRGQHNAPITLEKKERFAVDDSVLNGLTQRDLNEEASREYQRADDTLKEYYGKILKEYAKNRVFIPKFIEAQKDWVKFRDAYLDSVYPEEDKYQNYGSVFPMTYALEKANLTWERVKQLNGWLEPMEGDVGMGSRGEKGLLP